MGNINLPDNQASMYNELEARVRTLEGTARNGFSQMRFSRSIQPTPNPTVFGVWEDGTASGATYVDDLGGGGAGYGSVSVATGRRVLIIFGATVLGVGSSPTATVRTALAQFGVGINGVDPSLVVNYPIMYRRWAPLWPGNTPEAPFGFTLLRADLTPGINVFKAWANWSNTNPAGSAPTLNDVFLTVLPFGPG